VQLQFNGGGGQELIPPRDCAQLMAGNEWRNYEKVSSKDYRNLPKIYFVEIRQKCMQMFSTGNCDKKSY